ncbi:8-amino-7-oxononanoate synthase [Vibrio proteolyticus NBRC 13287]|uniref:8-amino-7-oxononanoate synthase n=2 Tax=Vibrio proteolyticus TaxID=671 RepID=U2ZYE7_VIBPR|nr:8-amino-7-oxononanoate synthase [Vibrio proteolyticus NBRC 13287]
MMPAFKARIASALESRRRQGLNRSLAPVSHGNRTALSAEGRNYINFSSNDYLGLANDEALKRAWQDGIDRFGNGSGASPLVTGFHTEHQRLESTLCEWLGYERAVLFNSGFSANQALLFALLEKGDRLLQDKLNHASLMEAGVHGPATMRRFRHNDVSHLEALLAEESNSLVVTEGVFSMDGDLAPLDAIAKLTAQRAWLAVDDAHGIGVLGSEGRGTSSYFQVTPELLVVTFGKAFGLSGAAILCDAETGEYLTQFARHHVYSTAMPPAQAHALTQATGMVRQQQWRRDKLRELSEVYDRVLSNVPGYVKTQTPIKPFVIGEAQPTVQVANHLRQRGFWMTAIRPPTVASGSARLRITLTAGHSAAQVEQMATAVRRFIEQGEIGC